MNNSHCDLPISINIEQERSAAKKSIAEFSERLDVFEDHAVVESTRPFKVFPSSALIVHMTP